MILFVNACVREGSRTKRLADRLLEKLKGSVKEVRLSEVRFPAADADFLRRRDLAVETGDYSDPMFDLAKDFARADAVVIAAPFWDLSFPAVLKQYFEHINVLGITFVYSDSGVPKGLCRAKRLFYVTTAGGPILCDEYGYGYVKALAQGFYGIPETVMIKAEGLDILGADVTAILKKAEEAVSAVE